MKRISIYSNWLVPDDQTTRVLDLLTDLGMAVATDGVSQVNSDITISTTDQYGNDLTDDD